MKLSLYVSVALLLMSSCDKSEQEKSLVVKDQVFDFGKVTLGDTTQHEFSFTNIGTQKIRIVDIRPGCTCLVSKLDASVIEPQQSINLLVKYVPDTDDASLSDVDRMIAVRTTDVQKIIILHMRGKVVAR